MADPTRVHATAGQKPGRTPEGLKAGAGISRVFLTAVEKPRGKVQQSVIKRLPAMVL
jgi:hypothetical protein